MPRKKSDIQKDLMIWAEQAVRPDEFIKFRFCNVLSISERAAIEKLANIDSSALTRRDFNKYWYLFSYFSDEALGYFLPKVLFLTIDWKAIQMLDVSEYGFVLFNFSDSGLPHPRLEPLVKQFPPPRRRLIGEFFQWEARYRYKSDPWMNNFEHGLVKFVKSNEFQLIFS